MHYPDWPAFTPAAQAVGSPGAEGDAVTGLAPTADAERPTLSRAEEPHAAASNATVSRANMNARHCCSVLTAITSAFFVCWLTFWSSLAKAFQLSTSAICCLYARQDASLPEARRDVTCSVVQTGGGEGADGGGSAVSRHGQPPPSGHLGRPRCLCACLPVPPCN